ncbi:DNA polymerase beta superfamily protein [Streptomyces kronopolitis]|uniref:DNA polymerase beta superfamily protein n=1 Tax=Streptomyces kronopolitis TaxID=1612435 RepID=UPI003D98A042
MPEAAAGRPLVAEHTVHACVRGSRAFEPATETGDTDRRGSLSHPPRCSGASRSRPPLWRGREEEFSWELEPFCRLGLRANPTVLECLHSPWWSASTRSGASCSRCAGRSCRGGPTAPSRGTRPAGSSSCGPMSAGTARPAGSTPCICCGCWPSRAICSARAGSPWTSATTGRRCRRSGAERWPGSRSRGGGRGCPRRPRRRSPARRCRPSPTWAGWRTSSSGPAAASAQG